MTTDAVGGVWQYSVDLAAALVPHGVETLLVLLGPAPSEAQRAHVAALSGVTLIETGLPLDWLCDAPDPVRAAGRAVAALAADQRVDLVQLNMPTLAADRAFDMPVVAVTHGCVATWWQAARGEPLAADFRWHQAMMTEGLAAADRIVAPSRAYAEIVAGTYDLPAMPHVVHNGRNLDRTAGGPPLHDCAITVGRLWDEVKNAGLLDRVAARLAVPFYAVGPTIGPHGETITLDHLHLLGTTDDTALARRLAERPIFVSAARFEPFGLAVLEAAAAGCALVLSDIPTFRELWDGAAMFVTDERGYGEAVERLVGDPALRLQLGEAARTRAARYTPEHNARAMLAIYDALTARQAQAAA